MIRGTTPTHIFKIPFPVSSVKEAMVIYAQDDIEVFRKDTPDCVMKDNEISVILTQEDTLLLNHRMPVQIQLRLLTTQGIAMASNVKVISVKKCLNNEVL